MKKDFFVRKNMKRKFLEILFFISELGGKIPFSRETGEEREITTILQNFCRKSPFYEAYE